MKSLYAALTAALILAAPAVQAKRTINIHMDRDAIMQGPLTVSKGETRNGDLVVQGSVTIAGVLNGDIAVMDGEVHVLGAVHGDIAGAGAPIDVAGEVTGDIASGGGAIHVTGRVLGSVALMGGDLTLGPKAELVGDVALLGGRFIKMPGAKFDGSVTKLDLSVGRRILKLASRFGGHAPVPDIETGVRTVGYLALMAFCLGSWFLLVLLTALLPRQIESIAGAVRADNWKCAGLGLLAILAICPGLVLLTISLIGIPLIPVATLAFGAAILMAFAAFALILATRVTESMARPAPSPLAGVAGGFFVMTSLTIAGKLLILAGASTLGGLLVFVNLILLSYGALVGLGGVMTTRFGTRA